MDFLEFGETELLGTKRLFELLDVFSATPPEDGLSPPISLLSFFRSRVNLGSPYQS